MTPSQVLTNIRAQVYEQSPTFWNDAEIYAYMWQAECEIAGMVECTEALSTIPSVIGQQEYDKPAGCLYISRVEYNLVPQKKIGFRDKDTLGFSGYGVADPMLRPTHYYEYGDKIGFWPVPADVQDIKVYFIRQPQPLTASTPAFTIPEAFHHYIIDYCLYRMYGKDQDEVRAAFYKQIFDENLVKARQKWRTRNNKGRFYVVKDSEKYYETELGII